MSGVCSSRDTRRITPNPMNEANTNTYNVGQKSTSKPSFRWSAPFGGGRIIAHAAGISIRVLIICLWPESPLNASFVTSSCEM
jgi:hypothetical protein